MMAPEALEPVAARHPWQMTERLLLLFSSLFLVAGYTMLGITATALDQPAHWLHFIAWLLCAIVGQLWLDRALPERDPLLFPLTMFLAGWGLLYIDRLAPIFADRQTLWLALGTITMLTVATLPQMLRWLRRYRYILLLAGLILLVSTIILGRNPSGVAGAPALWLGVGSIFFQPSEVLKIVLVAFLASYLAEQYPAIRAEELSGGQARLIFSPRMIGPVLLMWTISIVMLVWQRDLGTAILFFVIFLTMIYVASGSIYVLAGGAVLILIAGYVGYNLFSVVQLRVDIWLNPWLEADGRAYQIVQSLLAFASGGIFGQGIGQGLPDFIPVVHSDFILAAVAEESGLLGIFTLIAIIAAIVTRGLRIAMLTQRRSFHALLAVGLSMLIAVQSLLIMGGVLKLIPLTGVTLPFLSYGGSSLLISFTMVGLLLRLSAGKE